MNTLNNSALDLTLCAAPIAQFARWPLADHRNRGTRRGVYRHPPDVDPYRASREWKSVDVNRSVRRAGEGFLSHRVCDHRLDTRTNRGELRRS